MHPKKLGVLLMVLSLLYFLAGIWGGYQLMGAGGAVLGTVGLLLFIGGVWCLSATERKGLGLALMALPFLMNVGGIWGGFKMGSEFRSVYGSEFAPLAGMAINITALVIFIVGVWCLSKAESGTSEA